MVGPKVGSSSLLLPGEFFFLGGECAENELSREGLIWAFRIGPKRTFKFLQVGPHSPI